MPAGLSLYRAATDALSPFAGAWLRSRARAGKEDASRLQERFGQSALARPEGRLIWLHAASVGEMGVALALIEALRPQAEARFLLTTGTRTSADLFAKRAPGDVIHQFVPLDHADYARRFLDHWRPDLAIFVESELWPNLILEAAARGAPLALVNARMNESTLARWAKTPDSARALLSHFALLFAADQRTAAGLSLLSGRTAPLMGNLKLAAAPPQVAASLEDVRAAIGARPVWLAASTHPGEDEIALAAHALLRAKFPEALLIIAPRHPERGEAVARLAGGAPRRTCHEPIGEAAVYIADTMGELNALYALAPVALVCGSLSPALGGHNPIEPARAGAAILTGPFFKSFSDLFDLLRDHGAAKITATAPAIADTVSSLWSDETARARMIAAARACLDDAAPAMNQTRDALLTLLSNHQAGAHARA